jgi:hypothetical protein
MMKIDNIFGLCLFRHDPLIQISFLTMHRIQFSPIPDLIQTKSMKVMQIVGQEKQSKSELAEKSRIDVLLLVPCGKTLIAGQCNRI